MLEFIGLLVVGTILFGLAKGTMRSAASGIRQTKRKYEEAQTAAMTVMAQGNFRFPTWKSDARRLQTFATLLREELVRKGRQAPKIDQLLAEPYFVKGMLTAADAFETRGFSFAEQVVGVSDFMENALNKGLAERIAAAKGMNAGSAQPKARAAKNEPQRADMNIGGVMIPASGDLHRDMPLVMERLKGKILSLCPTELDLYRYLMEECDRFADGDEQAQAAVAVSGITELEYGGEVGKADRYRDNRRALDWLNGRASADLQRKFGPEAGEAMRVSILLSVIATQSEMIKALRLKYAVHYHNNCLSTGSFSYAARWQEVIEGITGEGDDEIPF